MNLIEALIIFTKPLQLRLCISETLQRHFFFTIAFKSSGDILKPVFIGELFTTKQDALVDARRILNQVLLVGKQATSLVGPLTKDILKSSKTEPSFVMTQGIIDRMLAVLEIHTDVETNESWTAFAA